MKQTKIEFIEHTKDEILAFRTYLVACYRQNEEKPFNYMIMTGSGIEHNFESVEGYKFYLLP